MQLSKGLKVIDWITRLLKYFFTKLKQLAWHIVKHPLGSLFWVVKAYLALMFLSLFVACSFGAFAQTGTPIAPTGSEPAKKTLVVNCQAFYNSEMLGTYTGETFAKCYEAASPSIRAKIKLPQATVIVDAFPLKRTTTNSFESLPSPAVGYRVIEKSVEQICYATPQGTLACDSKPETTHTYMIAGTVNESGSSESYVCPPDNSPIHTVGPDLNNRCHLPTPKPQKCWPTGGDWSLMPLYHFSDSASSQICAENDKGESCAWKKASKGVFVPDPQSPLDCDNTPPEPPPPPPTCSTSQNGLKACKADPNERCSKNGSAFSCDTGCGYVNGNFVCFDYPDEKEPDPVTPDKTPLKPTDDNITDPNKAISDMIKGDFKDVLRGAESRLDNVIISSENTQKTNEALLNALNASNRQSNRHLSSIDENTRAIKDNTSKIADSLTVKGDTGPIETPELDDERNNWETRNFGTVMKEQGNKLMDLPLFKSVDGFFDVSFGGSCPTYSVSVWVFEVNIDQFCSATMMALWPYIKAVVLLVCAFFAVRIALL